MLQRKFISELGREILLRLNTTDEAVCDDVFVHRYHIPPEPINPRSVLDLGCNIGLTMIHYAHLWPWATITGVEIDGENARLATLNSGLPVLVQAVVGATGIRYYDPTGEKWGFALSENGSQSVWGESLASLLRGTGSVDFVKMDIEGAEEEVLEATGWEQYVGSLLVEVHDGQASIDMITNLLTRRGFEVTRHTLHWSALWAKNPSFFPQLFRVDTEICD